MGKKSLDSDDKVIEELAWVLKRGGGGLANSLRVLSQHLVGDLTGLSSATYAPVTGLQIAVPNAGDYFVQATFSAISTTTDTPGVMSFTLWNETTNAPLVVSGGNVIKSTLGFFAASTPESGALSSVVFSLPFPTNVGLRYKVAGGAVGSILCVTGDQHATISLFQIQ